MLPVLRIRNTISDLNKNSIILIEMQTRAEIASLAAHIFVEINQNYSLANSIYCKLLQQYEQQ